MDECVDVSHHRQLFIDDAVIEEMRGVRRVSHNPDKHPSNPILREEYPWERGVLHPVYVLFDEDRGEYHLWYRSVDEPIGTSGGREHACYARSCDGVRWEKPLLDLAEFRGSTRNNIIGTGPPVAVMLDDETDDPGERFLGFWPGEKPFSLSFRSSGDGIHWSGPRCAETGDLRSAAAETPPNPLARYFFTGQCWSGRNAWGANRRAVMRCDSDDLVRWGGRLVVFAAGANDPENLEYYTMATARNRTADSYAGLHLGFLHPFHTDLQGRRNPVNQVAMSGTIDASLVTSRDTIDWRWVDRAKPFLPLGPEGSFDSGMVFLSSMIEQKDRLLFYYSGWNIDHGQLVGTPEKLGRADIGLATLRLDGFVSVEPLDGAGTLTTKPFTLREDTLVLNVDAGDGALLAEAIGEGGHAIPGLSADECDAVRADSIRHEVTWHGNRRLSALSGKTVRLRFHLTGATKLYSFALIGPVAKSPF